jgi:predicted nucleic acid-binding Zn ribbon protein
MANAATPGRHCDVCGRPLPMQNGPGRIRLYCDATCRSKARRTRQSTGMHVNKSLTNTQREGNLDNVRAAIPNDPVLIKVISAARVAVDGFPADPALTPLTTVTAVRSLARVVEEGLREAVQNARQAGHTWAEIGELLGTTRQAAFQRFGRPLDPRTGVPMSDTILPGAAERAAGLLADVAEQRWAQATDGFNQRMAQALDVSALAAAWARVVGMAGEYQGMGEPVAHQAGDYTVVDVPLRFEAAEMTGRVSYDRAGQVAGLFFLNQH